MLPQGKPLNLSGPVSIELCPTELGIIHLPFYSPGYTDTIQSQQNSVKLHFVKY